MDNQQGLYRKYHVTKANGEPLSGFHFVLSPEEDPAAFEALITYANKTTNARLQEDLVEWILDIKANRRQ